MTKDEGEEMLGHLFDNTLEREATCFSLCPRTLRVSYVDSNNQAEDGPRLTVDSYNSFIKYIRQRIGLPEKVLVTKCGQTLLHHDEQGEHTFIANITKEEEGFAASFTVHKE